MTLLPLSGDHVTLAQAVKIAGLAETGGQAKHLVRSGAFYVNGTLVIQPGKKLHQGDSFRNAAGEEWIITE